MKKSSQNQKNVSSTHNDIDDNSPKTLLEKIKEIKKSKDQKSCQNIKEIKEFLKTKRLLK